MSKNRPEIIQEIRDWKTFISSVDNIPLNPNHTYKDENNIYERLTEYVKDWAESVFGVYTNKNGELVNLPEEEEGSECKAWLEAVSGKITPLSGDWYQVALKGGKEGASLSLPQLNHVNFEDPQETMTARDEIKTAVHSTFFPAYRALRDSFSKRSIFQWIFNHRQYVAERDSLKVMTSLITSMAGYTEKELDAQYIKHKQDFKEEEIANAAIEYSNREININEPEEEVLFKDEKGQRLQVKVKKRSGETEVVEGERDELLAYGNYDGYFEDVMPMDEVLDIDYDEPIEEFMSAEEKLERFDNQDNIDDLCVKFMNELKTTAENEDSVWRALHVHMYQPMLKAASLFCGVYDAVKSANEGEKLKQEFAKITKNSAKHLFEIAFKALGEEDSREIVKDVNGKEVREKVGGSLFGIKTLKDRIVSAQKIANVVLANRTPAGFYPELAGDLVNTSHLMENADAIKTYIKANYADKYGESEIATAMKLAKNEFDVLQRGEKPSTSHVFEIGYRPDPWKLQEEQKLLGNAQKMIVKNVITDETIKTIVDANVNKWKQVRDMQKPNAKGKMSIIEKKWMEADEKLAETYKSYEATATESAVESALKQYNEQKKERPEPIKVELHEPKGEVAPPVEPKPMEISVPKMDK